MLQSVDAGANPAAPIPLATRDLENPGFGPQTDFSNFIHATKYRSEGETFREAMNRVASTLRDSDSHFDSFRDSILKMRFLPAGRIQAAVGTTRAVTPYNCFVSGTIEDSFVDGHGCIMDRAREAAATMRMGGGIGYDFSPLRPRGELIKKLMSQSSGAVSFMEIFDAICRCIASAGHRRGAQMGILRVDHPDIEEFIHVKQNEDMLTGFNLSIAITDEFMECVANQKPFMLRWGGKTYREIDALALWEQIMRATWDHAEPGVIFIDSMNAMNNLYYCENISATNPCSEQPLPPYGACLLGSLNLTKFIDKQGARWTFDWDQLTEDIPHVVRAMDNVVDVARYPLYEQEKEAKSKRRMGLGITGLANAGEALGFAYGSGAFLDFERQVMNRITNEAYRTSALLAKEKGSFPMFNKELYLKGRFISGGALNDETLDYIRRYGLRNSHLISVAPTGTISMSADNVSSGVEPVWAYKEDRDVNLPGGNRQFRLEDHGSKFFGVRGKIAEKVTIEEHLAVLATAQYFTDSAVSKTCNVPANTEWNDFKDIYMKAWELGCKGISTFQEGGKRAGIRNAVKEDDKSVDEPGSLCYVDSVTGRHECE